jgi:twitching motility protein PilU
MIDINEILTSMGPKEASDVYLVVGAPALLRVSGVCVPVTEDKLSGNETAELIPFFMNPEQIEKFKVQQEMNLAYSIPKVGRFRVNAFIQRGSVGFVIRMVKLALPSLEALGIPPILKDMVMLKHGLVLITGPTGTGKSTTLAAMVDHRNREATGHILTVEDPIEFIHPHKKSIVTQREIGMDTHTYHDALKNALRQAPDVVLIGEIRDPEAMQAALTFTETGHLVLGTLHTPNANQTLDRIINFFPREMHQLLYMQLSLNLMGICSQRLIPAADGKGRRVAVEILASTPRIRDLIHKGEVTEIKGAMEEATAEGCQTFDQSLYNLFRDGAITLDEALLNAESANNLRLRIKMEDPKALGVESPRLTLTRGR